ncbi:hypothetical protein QA640_44980 (plasmid) [Bradyrhizobium sp. CB82]|uniref:hypothetical protein n=1 Tax=Bradyrhizobium sp. CB82 TaxID=3039159 RepID=UPI0024B22B55|nr:hypothetical protein [Bradyrhizobium sp. CB82]WFU46155.1 hypothetical protein QA640_44980 [Bradyrhizobium sp. CB82]
MAHASEILHQIAQSRLRFVEVPGKYRVQRLFAGQGPTHHRCDDDPDRSVCAEALLMIAQLLLTGFLALVLIYAWSVQRTVPSIGLLASGAALGVARRARGS